MKSNCLCRSLSAFALLVAALFQFASFAANSSPVPIELWPKGAPGATGDSDEDKPAITPYLPSAAKNTGAAIFVCPGGGFQTRCTDQEGLLVAQWLNEHGIAAFVLRYRISPLYSRRESNQDAQRGLQYVRSHAANFHISPDRIGIIGFSAGSELAAAVAFKPLPGQADAEDPIERASSRVNFMVLAYGSSPLRGGGVDGAAADATTAQPDRSVLPPTFMFCTAEDTSHITGMLSLYTALRQARVPVESHFFLNGEHGVGFAQGDPVLGEWPNLMYNWIRGNGFLTDNKRVSFQGIVKVDGEPLARGCVILTPLDARGAPPIVAYVMNADPRPSVFGRNAASGPVRGEFGAAASQGAVPGHYRVEVREEAKRWMSNSRDPLIIKMNQKRGSLTEDERKEWYAYIRKRDLSPSIDKQHVYARKHPHDKKDQIIEIKAGAENRFDLEVFSK